jgi:hypothetical protein
MGAAGAHVIALEPGSRYLMDPTVAPSLKALWQKGFLVVGVDQFGVECCDDGPNPCERRDLGHHATYRMSWADAVGLDPAEGVFGPPARPRRGRRAVGRPQVLRVRLDEYLNGHPGTAAFVSSAVTTFAQVVGLITIEAPGSGTTRVANHHSVG